MSVRMGFGVVVLGVVLPLHAQGPAVDPPPASRSRDTLVVRGRFVDAATGTPLRRCRVELTGHQSTGYDLHWSAADWQNPPEQTTGDDGTFRFEVRIPSSNEPVDRNRYHLEASHAQFSAWFSHCPFFVARLLGEVDYGDIRLPKSVRPRVRCVDTNGALQAGVLLYLRPAPAATTTTTTTNAAQPTLGPESWIDKSAYAATDVDGYLHLDNALPPGDYTIRAENREVSRSPGTFTLPSADAIEVVVTALPADAILEGRVVDAAGSPVGNASLCVGSENGPGCSTRRDGRFTLLRTGKEPAGDAPIQMARNRRYDQWAHVATLAWGTRNATIEIPEQVKATFVVTDAQGRACETFNLYCLPAGANTRGGARLAGTFAGGKALRALEPGDYDLLVWPGDDRLAAADWQRIRIEGKEPEVAVKLAATHERRIELVFADAAAGPAAEVLVEVIEGGTPDPFLFVRPRTAAVDTARRSADPMVVAAVRSDRDGRAVVRLAEPGNVVLRCSGPTVMHRVVEVDLRQDAPARVELQRGTRLVGSLGPVAALPQLDPDFDPKRGSRMYDYSSWSAPTLTLLFDGGRQSREGVRIDPRGHFECDGLPAGPVEVQLHVWTKTGNQRRPDPTPHSLGTFELDGRTAKRVELSVPAALQPADQGPPREAGGKR